VDRRQCSCAAGQATIRFFSFFPNCNFKFQHPFGRWLISRANCLDSQQWHVGQVVPRAQQLISCYVCYNSEDPVSHHGDEQSSQPGRQTGVERSPAASLFVCLLVQPRLKDR
jgi:hypothetical protein